MYVFVKKSEKKEPVHDKSYNHTATTSEDSVQSAQPDQNLRLSHVPFKASGLSKEG